MNPYQPPFSAMSADVAKKNRFLERAFYGAVAVLIPIASVLIFNKDVALWLTTLAFCPAIFLKHSILGRISSYVVFSSCFWLVLYAGTSYLIKPYISSIHILHLMDEIVALSWSVSIRIFMLIGFCNGLQMIYFRIKYPRA